MTDTTYIPPDPDDEDSGGVWDEDLGAGITDDDAEQEESYLGNKEGGPVTETLRDLGVLPPLPAEEQLSESTVMNEMLGVYDTEAIIEDVDEKQWENPF